MKVVVYRKWDWILDCGEQQVDENEDLPNSYAKAFLDFRGYPYDDAGRISFHSD